jgi:putative heme-binding domain-containing protein
VSSSLEKRPALKRHRDVKPPVPVQYPLEFLMRARVFLFLFSLVGFSLRAAQNPFTGAEDRGAGREAFRTRCAACHGLDGSGGADAPDLTTGTFRRASTDVELFRIIASGIPGTSMTGVDLTSREIWQLVTYVRSLGVGRAAEKAKGSPARGEKVFSSSGCLECHSISGEGGHLGPDLSGVGMRRSLAELQRSLLEPDAEVSPDYWRVRARTRGGEVVTGVRLNEDTYWYQIRDINRRLRVLAKQELIEHEVVRTSAMPSLRGKLAEGELEDLVAYLAGLDAAAQKGGTR